MRRDSTSHTDREETLKIAKYKSIFINYTHLLTASRIARYLEDSDSKAKYSTFTNFMGNDGVKSLVAKRLYAVEQQCIQFLSDAGKKLLTQIDPSKI